MIEGKNYKTTKNVNNDWEDLSDLKVKHSSVQISRQLYKIWIFKPPFYYTIL